MVFPHKAFGGNSFSVMNLDPGFYTVTCTRKYYGNISGPTTSYSRTLSVFPSSDPSCCPTAPCHEARMLPDQIDIDSKEIAFAAWPRPAQGQLTISFATEKEEEVKISMVSLIHSNQSKVILTESKRPTGNFLETYYVSHLPNGIYLLSVTAAGKVSSQRIVISN